MTSPWHAIVRGDLVRVTIDRVSKSGNALVTYNDRVVMLVSSANPNETLIVRVTQQSPQIRARPANDHAIRNAEEEDIIDSEKIIEFHSANPNRRERISAKKKKEKEDSIAHPNTRSRSDLTEEEIAELESKRQKRLNKFIKSCKNKIEQSDNHNISTPSFSKPSSEVERGPNRAKQREQVRAKLENNNEILNNLR